MLLLMMASPVTMLMVTAMATVNDYDDDDDDDDNGDKPDDDNGNGDDDAGDRVATVMTVTTAMMVTSGHDDNSMMAMLYSVGRGKTRARLSRQRAPSTSSLASPSRPRLSRGPVAGRPAMSRQMGACTNLKPTLAQELSRQSEPAQTVQRAGA